MQSSRLCSLACLLAACWLVATSDCSVGHPAPTWMTLLKQRHARVPPTSSQSNGYIENNCSTLASVASAKTSLPMSTCRGLLSRRATTPPHYSSKGASGPQGSICCSTAVSRPKKGEQKTAATSHRQQQPTRRLCSAGAWPQHSVN